MELGSSAFITIDGVSKSFTNREQTQVVLKQISAHIHKGEIISILGESGCGKSTLLNLIGVFE